MITRDAASWSDTTGVRTLEDAKTCVGWLRPPNGSPAEDWRAYHLAAAEVYDRVAEIDRIHHYEARAYAQVERNKAERLGLPRKSPVHRPSVDGATTGADAPDSAPVVA